MRLVDGSGWFVGECVEDVGVGFFEALLHGHVFDHFSGVFDDGVVLFAHPRIVRFVLFCRIHLIIKENADGIIQPMWSPGNLNYFMCRGEKRPLKGNSHILL